MEESRCTHSGSMIRFRAFSRIRRMTSFTPSDRRDEIVRVPGVIREDRAAVTAAIQ